MSLTRKRTRKTDTIDIDSSSESSQASEDSAPESDADTPSKHGGYAAENDMSQRQTRKINSGNFGMFNRPTLTTRSPRTPRPGRKKRATEFSVLKENSLSRRSRKRNHSGAELIGNGHDDDDDDDDMTLFIPEDGAMTLVEDDNAVDEEQLYNDLPPDRAQRVKEYLKMLSLIKESENKLQAVETELEATSTQQAGLALVFANIDTTAENKIAEILDQRDEKIRLANEHAQSEVRKIKEGLPLKKASHEERLREYDESRKAVEERVMEATFKLGSLRTTKLGLERQGGFNLGIDVRTVQNRSLHK